MKGNVIVMALMLLAASVNGMDARNAGVAKGHKRQATRTFVDRMPLSKTHFPSWMKMVQGGTCLLGSEDTSSYCRPVHEASVGNFYMSEYEVTQLLWQKIMGSNPSATVGRNFPVEDVTWYDCIKFCNALNRYMGLHECYVIDGDSVYYNSRDVKDCFRLPTDAEWEYAARGGRLNHGYVYSGSNNIGVVAWNTRNSGFCIHPVGLKKPNELGLYDMSGNVGEMCWDECDDFPSGNTNSLGRSACISKVVRGGSWSNEDQQCFCHVSSGMCRGVDAYDMETGMRLAFVGDTSKIGICQESSFPICVAAADSIAKMPLEKSVLPQWMVKVDGGKYTLGALTHEPYEGERSKHTVTLQAYYISKYEITCGLWGRVMRRPDLCKKENYPMTGISFYDCARFCNALSVCYGYKPCYKNSEA